jgi:hypothetical protein
LNLQNRLITEGIDAAARRSRTPAAGQVHRIQRFGSLSRKPMTLDIRIRSRRFV